MSRKRRRQTQDTGDSNSDIEIIPAPPAAAIPAAAPAAIPAAAPAAAPVVAATLNEKARRRAAFDEAWETANKTPEQVLKEQRAGWSSDVYKHFLPPTVVEHEGDIKYRFACRAHPAEVVMRVRWDNSTSNLSRHVNKCEGRRAPDDQQIQEFAHGSTYSKARMRYLLCRWVSVRHRPYAIVQDAELMDIFRMLFAKVEVPHPTTLSRDIREVHQRSLVHWAKILKDFEGRFHLCVDGWTAPNVISFLGVTAQRAVDGKLQRFILDFLKLSSAHNGDYLAGELAKCLKEFGLDKKILGVACDNASNNTTMMEKLEILLPGGAHSLLTKINCLAHVANLVVKAIVLPFTTTRARRGKAAGKDSEEEEVDLMLEGLLDDSDLPVEDASEQTMEDGEEEEFELEAAREAFDQRFVEEVVREVEFLKLPSAEEAREARYAVTKLTQLAKRVFHSPTIREDLAACCTKSKIEPRQMVRSVATRWNSLVDAINRAIYLRPALEKLLAQSKYDKDGNKGLRRFRLSPVEWTILTQLQPILKAFLLTTERVSKSNVPLLHEVIPLIDVLTARLDKAAKDLTLHIAVRNAASRGIEVLNKYYSKTDESVMYRCAMILHPSYKLNYFRTHGWQADWIDIAEEIFREQWESHYRPEPATAPSSPLPRGSSSRSAMSIDDDENIFAEIDNYSIRTSNDPIQEYLDSSTEGVSDPLGYWTSRLGHHPLARMALDFLSAPAASVDVERAFSRGGLMVSKRRHALSDASVRAGTVLSSWASIEGAIPEADIIQAFKDKSRRIKKTDIPNMYVEEVDFE